jgi:hypothetical protein
MDLIANPKVKIPKGKGVGRAFSLAPLRGIGGAKDPSWSLDILRSKSIIHTHLHKPKNKLVNA